MKNVKNSKLNGFTLVEVIITLVVLSVVGTMIFTTLGKSMTHSSDPIFRMKTSFGIQRIMENMVTAYEKYYAGDLPGFNVSIGSEGTTHENSGYCSETTGCKYTVIENHFIKLDESNNEVPAGTTDKKNLLKVTIRNSNNETLTYIFAG